MMTTFLNHLKSLQEGLGDLVFSNLPVVTQARRRTLNNGSLEAIMTHQLLRLAFIPYSV